jgi:ABC-2 type transport system permease protein
MGPTFSILKRELGAYFNTPIGYVFMIAFLVLATFFYVQDLFVTGNADMRRFFEFWVPVLFLFLVPGIAMRLWSEERKIGTMELLMTMPVKTWQAVIGKFSAGVVFLLFTLLLTFPIPLTLWALLPEKAPGLDWGVMFGQYSGAMVLGMIYLAIGSFASSLTSDQIVAFIVGIFINAVLLFLSYPLFLGLIRDWSPTLASQAQRFGAWYHFDSISRGVVDTRDIIYAVTMTGLFLLLNVLVIERRR